MTAHRITDSLWRLRLDGFQAYLWRDTDGVTLIDAGPVGATRALADSLADLGLAPGDVDRVVLTHFHDDHAGGARFLAGHGVQVVAHRCEAPFIDGSAERPEPHFTPDELELHNVVAAGLEPAPTVTVDQTVGDGETLPIGAGAVVIATPGHTDGSLALFLPQQGVLFTGDTVAEHQGQIILGVFNLNLDLTAASFARVAELDAEIACFGHGEPVTRSARAVLSAASSRRGSPIAKPGES